MVSFNGLSRSFYINELGRDQQKKLKQKKQNVPRERPECSIITCYEKMYPTPGMITTRGISYGLWRLCGFIITSEKSPNQWTCDDLGGETLIHRKVKVLTPYYHYDNSALVTPHIRITVAWFRYLTLEATRRSHVGLRTWRFRSYLLEAGNILQGNPIGPWEIKGKITLPDMCGCCRKKRRAALYLKLFLPYQNKQSKKLCNVGFPHESLTAYQWEGFWSNRDR